ncbi:MAG: HEAT repeat domain-containing protein [Chloroflexi bacterium]|nr:HEAT repeat domain-containing protein [Chloroflexota bacterium]
MKTLKLLLILSLVVGISACQPPRTPPTPPAPSTMDEAGFPTEMAAPTFAPVSPEPTVPIPQPTVTLTPIPLPSVEEIYQRYENEIQPQVGLLAIAPETPDDFSLSPASDWQVTFLPLDERGYYVQYLLFGDDASGNPTGSTKLIITYAYERTSCLGLWGLTCDTQATAISSRLYVELEGNTYLLDELPTWSGGVNATSEWEIFQFAVYPFSKLGNDGEEIERTLELLVGFAAGVDPISAWHAGTLSTQARVAILRQALTSAFWSDRDNAADSLAEIGPDAAEAVPELINALSDVEDKVRIRAVTALRQIGPAAAEAVPALIGLLEDESLSYAHSSIIAAIGKIGPVETVLPTLVSALKDTDAAVRETAAEALGAYGAAAAPAVPDLIPLLADEDVDVRKAAADALGLIGPAASAAVPALIEALNTETEWTVQFRLVDALGSIGPEAAPAVPSLILIVEGGGNSADNAIVALGNIGPAAAVAVPAILPYLQDQYDVFVAVEALGKMGPAAIQAVPALIDALRNQHVWFAHEKVAGALTAITGQNFGEDADLWQAWWEQNKP